MILHDIVTTCDYVTTYAKDVSINYERLDDMISRLDFSKTRHWLDTNPYGILDNDLDYIINFLFFYHTIGDFCFWGNPKWSIEADGKVLDGSYAMIYLLISNFKEFIAEDLTYEKYLSLVAGSSPLPLAKERYDFLVMAKAFLKDRNFADLIRGKLVDEELFNYIISNLDFFIDEATYENNRIYFYKRAQLLTSDIMHMKKSSGMDVCYDNLVGCADYKIPQVLRNLGVLEFSPKLSSLVDSGIPIMSGTKQEVEIRATTISVINYIADTLANQIARMDINDSIWLLGQNKSINTKPYHKTLTTKY